MRTETTVSDAPAGFPFDIEVPPRGRPLVIPTQTRREAARASEPVRPAGPDLELCVAWSCSHRPVGG